MPAQSPIAYVNGRFLPQHEATISVMDRGFLFADGIYEVTAVLDGRLVDNDLHMARLVRSVGEIGLALPEPIERIVEIHHELVRRNGLQEGLIYLQVTRGAEATRNFAFPKAATPSLVMFCDFKEYADSPQARTGIRTLTVPDLRWARRDIKSVALLAQVLAKQAAAEAGCQEAIMHENGTVTEGGSSTVFVVLGEGAEARIVTRENGRHVLPGCTRKALLTLVAETGIAVEERPFTLDEVKGAVEVFITSATSFVMPVVEVDGLKIGGGQPGPVARRLRELYLRHARG